jgi:hypothetical protein
VAWRGILGTLKHTLTTSGPLRSCCKRRRGSAPDRAFVYWLSFISRWREEAEKWLHDMVGVLVIYVEFHHVCESPEKFQHMIYGTWSLLVRSLIDVSITRGDLLQPHRGGVVVLQAAYPSCLDRSRYVLFWGQLTCPSSSVVLYVHLFLLSLVLPP